MMASIQIRRHDQEEDEGHPRRLDHGDIVSYLFANGRDLAEAMAAKQGVLTVGLPHTRSVI